MPKIVKKFLIQHEVGHVKRNHLEGKSKTDIHKMVLLRMIGITPKIEYEADAYAVSVLGKEDVKEAIKFLLTNTNLPILSKIEFVKRYLKIK